MATLIKKKFIGDDQVDGLKLLLENGQFLRIKNADNTITSIDPKQLQTETEIDAKVAAEATLRSSADTTLQGNIDVEKARITQEISDRTAADASLDSRIDALEIAHHKHKHALLAADLTAGYVNLPHAIKANSLIAHIDRLGLHEGVAEDYTLSLVGGVTRVTFVSTLIAAGDNLYFKYEV